MSESASWVLALLLALSILFNFPSVVLLAAYCWAQFRRRTCVRDDRLAIGEEGAAPSVLIQIPTFNESAVIGRVLEAVARQEWPRSRFQVQVLDDSTDHTPELAAAMVGRLREEGVQIELRRRTDRGGFKAGALQAGLGGSAAPYVAILDADYVPSPDWLRSSMAPLLSNHRLAFVQSRISFLNRNASWFTRGQALVLDNHYVVEQGGREAVGLIVPFNGTCGVWRRQAIDAVGGWSGDTLVEDMDLSFRAEAAGWRGRYLLDVSVPGELPGTIRDWIGQQRRWSRGTAQIVRKTVRRIFEPGMGLRFRLSLAYQLLNIFAAPVSIAALVSGAVYWSQMPIAIGAASILFGVALALIVARVVVSPLVVLATTRDLRGGRILIDLPCSIVVVLLGAGISTLAAIRGLSGRPAPFVRTRKTGNVSGK